jgi:hypothetical protein
LLDDEGRGLLYHQILYDFFARIKNEEAGSINASGAFNSAHIPLYKQWLRECAEKNCAEYDVFQGPLAAPLLSPMARALASRLGRLLELEKTPFDLWTVAELEEDLAIQDGTVLINGRIDRVSVSPDDKVHIIDYKTGMPPSKKSCWNDDDMNITDFQIPLYIMLYEHEHKTVDGASFMSINNHKLAGIVKDGERESYQATLDTFRQKVNVFSERARALRFSDDKADWTQCAACIYNAVCRRTYTLTNVMHDTLDTAGV